MTEETTLDLQEELVDLGAASQQTEGAPIGVPEEPANFLG